MLDWFVRHRPDAAHWTIGEIMREAHHRWGAPADATIKTLCAALDMDGDPTCDRRSSVAVQEAGGGARLSCWRLWPFAWARGRCRHVPFRVTQFFRVLLTERGWGVMLFT